MIIQILERLFAPKVGDGPWRELPDDARYFLERSDTVADQQRKVLVTLHVSALGALFVAAAWFAPAQAPSWAIIPGICFFAGLVLTNVSYGLAKWRAIKRFESAREDKGWPAFPDKARSLLWEGGSLIFFILGVTVALFWLPDSPHAVMWARCW